MPLHTVIFDMDGLLIDSEPQWYAAANETLGRYNKTLTRTLYDTTTGLRTKEFVAYWFRYFDIPESEFAEAEKDIIARVMHKITTAPVIMPAVPYIFSFFKEKQFKIGIASSSPPEIIERVVHLCGIENYVQAMVSAETLPYGKPHPQVYLDCAARLGSTPESCICFEDSFNGMIAVKAARMKCVIVPAPALMKDPRWAAADLKIASLQNFNDLHLALF